MNNRYQLLIFDWDGTLMDSQAHIVASMQASMSELGLEVLDHGTISNIIGLGMREALQRLFPALADDAFHAAFTACYRRHYFADDAPQALFAHAERTLRQLHADGFLLAVATGKGRHGLDKSLLDTGLQTVFHAHRCAEETASKPDPRMVYELLDELQVAPAQAVMIGDSEYDLQMAQNAGIDAIAVSYGVHDSERLLRYEPRACLDCISDLPQVLSGAAPRPARRSG